MSGSGSGAIDFPGLLGLHFVVFVRVSCSVGSSGGSRVGVSFGRKTKYGPNHLWSSFSDIQTFLKGFIYIHEISLLLLRFFTIGFVIGFLSKPNHESSGSLNWCRRLEKLKFVF